MFPPETFLTDEQIDLAVIDAALNSVEDQHVIRELQAGKSWKVALGGDGGSNRPVWWRADKLGIEVFWNSPEKKRLIKPARILERAKQFKAATPF